MIHDEMDADVTMAGGAESALLANRYRIVRQLGAGGMGSVWLAEDTELDDRQVAIKMLPSILLSNKRAYKQIKSEALVSLKLTHPNIATLRSFVENNGNPFLVIDYIKGRPLDDYLAERGALTEQETVALLSPIAAALDYAHARNVIHRDVKPSNVMIADDGVILTAIPGKNHLLGLKEILYDKPYLNDEKEPALEGLEVIERILS